MPCIDSSRVICLTPKNQSLGPLPKIEKWPAFRARGSAITRQKSKKEALRSRLSGPVLISALAVVAIITHLVLRYMMEASRPAYLAPLVIALILGGIPLVFTLVKKAVVREFGSDLLAGISIITSVLLGEYLVGVIVVLMLSGGSALEEFASRRASSVLSALAKRIPEVAHRRTGLEVHDVPLHSVRAGDLLVIFPHEFSPVDGIVVEGYGKMDEAYLTGEPFEISKAPGSSVISGAINGESALTIRAEKPAADSRYASIVRIMEHTEQIRPKMRRLGDKLGAWYTPVALLLALAAWAATHQSLRFLAVLVVATPCPLLIAIPVAVIGAISLSARRAIIIKNPGILEEIDLCQTLVLDKTGTLTYGKPQLAEIDCAPGCQKNTVLQRAASIEFYSKHPLSAAILDAAKNAKLALEPASEVSERPGEGLRGTVAGHTVWITGRSKVSADLLLPPVRAGLECLVFLDEKFAAVFRFHDAPRTGSRRFVSHLKPRHAINRILLVSGDREPEVRLLGSLVGITEIYSAKSPEDKVAIVQAETRKQKTLFLGDGINDAPAMQAATVGVAFGAANDVTSEAADAVILEKSLEKVDELMHIGRRMRYIALESAVGGIALSIVGMIFAAAGLLPPIAGAIAQEAIDLAAVLNAVRVSLPFKSLTDF